MSSTEQTVFITQTGNQIGSAFYLLDNFGFFGVDSSFALHCNSICAHNHVCSFQKFRASVLMKDLRPLRPVLNRSQSLSFHWIKMVMFHITMFSRRSWRARFAQVCQIILPKFGKIAEWRAYHFNRQMLTLLSYPFTTIALYWLWYNEQK